MKEITHLLKTHELIKSHLSESVDNYLDISRIELVQATQEHAMNRVKEHIVEYRSHQSF